MKELIIISFGIHSHFKIRKYGTRLGFVFGFGFFESRIFISLLIFTLTIKLTK